MHRDIARRTTALLPVLAAVLSACASRTAAVTGPVSVPGVRAVATATNMEIRFDTLVAYVMDADVVFFGEQHDDPETHRVEFGLLDALGRSGRPVVLSLEMFERDAQVALDDYLAGRTTEAAFLARSRPWERYVTDYRPMVELARARGWPVVAANVPRSLASAVGRKGLSALDTLTAVERRWAATDLQCPRDAYHARFMDDMKGHSAGGAAPSPGDSLPTAIAERYYLAQCVKDETMAESIANAMRRAPSNAIVVHYNGAFHSDYGQGTAERLRRRAGELRLAIITAVPMVDPSEATAQGHDGRADYLIFTKRIPPKAAVIR